MTHPFYDTPTAAELRAMLATMPDDLPVFLMTTGNPRDYEYCPVKGLQIRKLSEQNTDGDPAYHAYKGKPGDADVLVLEC